MGSACSTPLRFYGIQKKHATVKEKESTLTQSFELGVLPDSESNNSREIVTSEKRSSSREVIKAANFQPKGLLGGPALLPAVRFYLKGIFMSKFLTQMYNKELKADLLASPNNSPLAWGSVSYCPPVSSMNADANDNDNADDTDDIVHEDEDKDKPPQITRSPHRTTPTMNVAMPDFAAEYWTTFVPPTHAPLFMVKFPSWAIFTNLTIYNSNGVPISSVNGKMVERFISGGKGGGINVYDDPRIHLYTGDEDGGEDDGTTVLINLAHGVKAKKLKRALCVVFRVYRPNHIPIIPHEEKPTVYLINRSIVNEFNAQTHSLNSEFCELLKCSDTKDAFLRGENIGKKFTGLINKHLKPLEKHQFGTQFFHPASVVGLFVNSSATYVICFVPDSKIGIRMKGRVPTEKKWRPYFGIMTIDYHTTSTITSLSTTDLGGWNAEFDLFAFRTLEQAVDNGYDSKNNEHKLLLWGESQGPLGLVLRYLHYFENLNVDDGGGDETVLAEEERRKLRLCDGRRTAEQVAVEGVGDVIYV